MKAPGTLERLGFAAYAEAYEAADKPVGAVPARIVAEYKGGYVVRDEARDGLARLGGQLRRDVAEGRSPRPAVGDWAVVTGAGEPWGRIESTLPRRSEVIRKAAGRARVAQALAVNVDAVFVVAPLTPGASGVNLRRLERYFTLVREGRGQPVLVLTKADLVTAEERAEALAAVGPVVGDDVPVHAVSVHSGEGLADLEQYFEGDATVGLLGPSGAGKSTLVNAWMTGAEGPQQAVAEVDGQGRGRHTTTHRALFVRAAGGVVLDTPGLREVGLLEASLGVLEAFTDVEALAEGCRFRDCAHDGEPGCAVEEAVKVGSLPASRAEAFRKLRAEALLREEGARESKEARGAAASRALRAFYRDERKRGGG